MKSPGSTPNPQRECCDCLYSEERATCTAWAGDNCEYFCPIDADKTQEWDVPEMIEGQSYHKEEEVHVEHNMNWMLWLGVIILLIGIIASFCGGDF